MDTILFIIMSKIKYIFYFLPHGLKSISFFPPEHGFFIFQNKFWFGKRSQPFKEIQNGKNGRAVKEFHVPVKIRKMFSI